MKTAPDTLPKSQNLRLGRHGEDMAAASYIENGWEVLHRNWRCREGEIDLILKNKTDQNSTLVFCEVKTRSSKAFGWPSEAVNHSKQKKIRHLAAKWLQEESEEYFHEIRFDVVEVLGGELRFICNAF